MMFLRVPYQERHALASAKLSDLGTPLLVVRLPAQYRQQKTPVRYGFGYTLKETHTCKYFLERTLCDHDPYRRRLPVEYLDKQHSRDCISPGFAPLSLFGKHRTMDHIFPSETAGTGRTNFPFSVDSIPRPL